MFEPIPELSADLDWMLQSGQASTEMLAEALVNEYYIPVFRLAFSLLNDLEAARKASVEIFSAALLNVYRYRNTTSVRTWLYRIVIDVCRRAWGKTTSKHGPYSPIPGTSSNGRRPVPAEGPESRLWLAVESLPEKLRLLLILQELHNWPVLEIAAVLQAKESSVQAQISQARSQYLINLLRSGQIERNREADSLFEQLQHMFQARWLAPHHSRQELDLVRDEIIERAGSQGSRRRRLMSIKEITLTLIAILLVAGLIWGANMLVPEPEPAELPVPTRRINPAGSGQAGAGIEAGAAASGSDKLIPTLQSNQAGPILPDPSQDPESAVYTVQQGDSLGIIANQFGSSAEELRIFNRLAPGDELHEGQRLFIPGNLPAVTPLAATPVTPVAQLAPVETPTSSTELVQRVQQNVNTWNTVWIDAQSKIYGPEGYIGPSRVTHSQVWISREQLLLLIGSPGGDPDEIILRNGSRYYRARPGYGQPWFLSLNRENPADSPTQDQINLLFGTLFGQRIVNQNTSLQVTGSGEVADRKALVINELNADGKLESRMWVDEHTGFILRKRQFHNQGNQRLVNEVIVDNIAFDVNFPQELFDPQLPWRGGFAGDFSGEPILAETGQPSRAAAFIRLPMPNRPPPQDFNVSQSTLTFYYSPGFNDTDAMASTYLFAGPFYLGNIVFGNPWSMICSRSPNGQKITFVSQPGKSPPQDASLYWFDLSNLRSQLHRPLGDISVTNFVFAPDGRRLAAFGFDGQFSLGSIYIVDTETDEYEIVQHLLDTRSLIWSPDGEYLAMIAAPISLFEEEVMVIRASTGEIIYRAAFDSRLDNLNAQWPLLDWGVEFPVEMGGLKACVNPPGG